MAIGAGIEGQTGVARLVVSTWCVTLGARHLRVQTGEGIASFVVVELRGIFPIFEVVALLAVRSQPATVLIFMAVYAIGRNA